MNASRAPSVGGPIVHVSADYPDDFEPFKTVVIRTLVELVADRFDQQVISLNRKAPTIGQMLRIGPRPHLEEKRQDGHLALRYAAPGKGLWHRTVLLRLGDDLAERLSRGPRPSLIVGHKLTVEGIVVARAAKLLSIPYALSIQGDTDTRILSVRRDLSAHYRKIFHEAAVVFPFAPWALTTVEAVLGERSGPTILLPCPTELDTPIAPVAGNGSLVSAFHLKNRKRKNLVGMISAIDIAKKQGADLRLDIMGGGTAEEQAAVKAILSPDGSVETIGRIEREQMAGRLNRYSGFVLPSLRESFGLVFVEAFFAGLPAAYPKGTAVSGFFDHCPFALPVDAKDPQSIADAMIRLCSEEHALKSALEKWQNSSHATRFRRSAIARAFGDGLAHAASHGDAARLSVENRSPSN